MAKSRAFCFAALAVALGATSCGEKLDPFVESSAYDDIELPDLGGDSTGTTYKEIRSLMFNNCVVCHSASNPSAGYAFDTFESTKRGAAKGLTAMQNGSMPPGDPLPALSIALFKDWFDNGMPEGAPASCP